VDRKIAEITIVALALAALRELSDITVEETIDVDEPEENREKDVIAPQRTGKNLVEWDRELENCQFQACTTKQGNVLISRYARYGDIEQLIQGVLAGCHLSISAIQTWVNTQNTYDVDAFSPLLHMSGREISQYRVV
jgi:hypothetical protein